MRLGIDLDGVVADFNQGWMRFYNEEFGTDLRPDQVDRWDAMLHLTHFRTNADFWGWARDLDGASLFRHLTPYPGAVDALHALAARHDIVIVTSKPDFAVHDTFAWIAEHALPTREVHITDRKHTVACDVFLDDGPHVLHALSTHRPEAHVHRFVRPWNFPLRGVTDIGSWAEFRRSVAAHG